ncbi:MAG TPA: response regulator transcription factor [Burkholderiales bacterium]|nr:response regulator transcription factor [Burkholderiales bacterium]
MNSTGLHRPMQTQNGTLPGQARRCSILVVEDHEPLRRSVVTWLECRFPACRVRGVETAEEALALPDRPDIVLMDINLRGVDGLEATSRIKALKPGTRIIILTMHDTPHHRRAAAEAGAEGFIAKRDMEMQLEPAVASLLKSRSGSAS